MMEQRKAINILDKLIQCKYLQDADKCPNVICGDCEYNIYHYDASEIIEAMKMALEALESDTDVER